MILGLLGCGLALHRPIVTFGEPVALPIVRPSSDDERWYVPTEVEGLGPGLWFVDTGYTNTTCDDGLAVALGLEVVDRGRTHGDNGTLRVGRARLPPFRLGGHVVDDLVCVVRDLATTSSVRDPSEGPVVGVLGMDVLARFRMVIDPTAPSLLLEAPGEPVDGVTLRLTGGPHPRARLAVELDGERRWMLLDTGTPVTWVDGDRLGWTPTRSTSATIVASGGARTVEQRAYDVGRIVVGDLPRDGATVFDRPVGPGRADLLGLDLLDGVRVTLDPTHRRARLERVAPTPPPAWSTVLAEGPDGRYGDLRPADVGDGGERW